VGQPWLEAGRDEERELLEEANPGGWDHSADWCTGPLCRAGYLC
jgi:hypothetical protein